MLNSVILRKVILALCLFAFLFLFPQNKSEIVKPQNKIVVNKSSGLPIRLKIPKIQVDATVQLVGVTIQGIMEAPQGVLDVGWFKLGPRPGDIGSAVIAGHFDGQQGEPAIFFNLYKLEKGDEIYVVADEGKSITFVVRESRIYNSGYADEVFNARDSEHLNLVTCDGVWDGTAKSYTKRLVVFADIQN